MELSQSLSLSLSFLRLFLECGLATFFFVAEVTSDNSLLTSFSLVKTDGQPWELHDSRTSSMTSFCLKCASECSRNRDASAGGYRCVGFRCEKAIGSSGGTCHFYQLGSTPLPHSGTFSYIRDPPVFHTVVVSGQPYAIHVSPEFKSYDDAQKLCSDMGGYLLHMDNPAVLTALSIVSAGLPEQWYFIGANDKVEEDTWILAKDNSPVPDWWNWFGKEPDDYEGQDCATFNIDRLDLYDSVCEDTHLFICQRDA